MKQIALPPDRVAFRRLLWTAFFVSFATLAVFKVVLFVYSASGAEGETGGLRMAGKLLLCLGWDVVGAALATAICAGPLWLMRERMPRAAFGFAVAWQGLHGLFVALSHRLWRVMGAPFDKSAIDLAFFNADPRRGQGGQWDMASSVAPYLTGGLALEVALAALLPALALVWLHRRLPSLARHRRPAGWGFAGALLLTLVLVPILVRTRVLHIYLFDQSPLPLLTRSYLRGPWRQLQGIPVPVGDKFCLDLRSPLPPAEWPENPLRAAKPAPTNLVVVFLESIASRYLAERPPAMPFLEGLGDGAGSVRFAAHYSTWPQTMQALFSLFCSELPYPDGLPISYINPAIPCVSLPEALAAAGYSTALFTSGDLAFERKLRFYKHRHLGEIVDRHDMPGREGAWNNTWSIDERVTVQAVLRWIDRQAVGGKPFFAIYNTVAGHHPYEIPGRPPATAGQEDEARRATYRYVDDRLREIVAGIQQRGLSDKTLIAIISDHGPGSGRPGMGQARDASIYEGSVHVPFALVGPQLAPTGGSVTFPTSHLDFAPTLLGLLGVAAPATMKGRDLSHSSVNHMVAMGTRPPLEQFGLRAGDQKLIRSASGAVELFNLGVDPDERTDLAAQQPELVERMMPQAVAWPAHSLYLIENYAAVLGQHGSGRCPQ